MRCKVGRHFEFEASHKLPDKEIYGKCSSLHGHRYELEIEVEGELKDSGWICNFSEIKEIVNKTIIEKFDHTHLNQYFEIPTVENIAQYVYEKVSREFIDKDYKLTRVRIYETNNCYAEIISG